MMKPSVSMIGFLFLASMPVVSLGDEARADERVQDARNVADQVQPPRSGRLRFRDGPVCMCSQGMSEEDIQRSREERRKEDGSDN